MPLIDINCDMGEGFGAYTIGDDVAMLEIVSSANIACGFHAGDPNVMDATLRRAATLGVGAGAHPGFLDLYGFGRRQIRGDSPAEIERQIVYQIGALQALATAAGTRLSHVKAHGALGNMTAEEPDLAGALAGAIRSVDRDLIMVVMPGMATEAAAEKHGLPMCREIYCDRAYADNGNLLSRKLPGAVFHDPRDGGRARAAHARRAGHRHRIGPQAQGPDRQRLRPFRHGRRARHGESPAGKARRGRHRGRADAAGDRGGRLERLSSPGPLRSVSRPAAGSGTGRATCGTRSGRPRVRRASAAWRNNSLAHSGSASRR